MNDSSTHDYVVKKDKNGKQTIQKINVEFGEIPDGYEIIKIIET